MKKLLHILIALGTVVFYAGGLIFVFGQAICLLIGQPEMMVKIEEAVSTVIFPAISVTGLLCFFYSYFMKEKKVQG